VQRDKRSELRSRSLRLKSKERRGKERQVNEERPIYELWSEQDLCWIEVPEYYQVMYGHFIERWMDAAPGIFRRRPRVTGRSTRVQELPPEEQERLWNARLDMRRRP
jgi:hypothetical protein